MYLRKISIKNFRVFGEKGVDLVFHKGVNAIIGGIMQESLRLSMQLGLLLLRSLTIRISISLSQTFT